MPVQVGPSSAYDTALDFLVAALHYYLDIESNGGGDVHVETTGVGGLTDTARAELLPAAIEVARTIRGYANTSALTDLATLNATALVASDQPPIVLLAQNLAQIYQQELAAPFDVSVAVAQVQGAFKVEKSQTRGRQQIEHRTEGSMVRSIADAIIIGYAGIHAVEEETWAARLMWLGLALGGVTLVDQVL